MAKEKGYVYIMTNPSFKDDWVKIGYTVNLESRVRELSRATGIPLPFEIYATLKTVKYKEVEHSLHRIIDRISSLRVAKNKEFFNITPSQAYELLYEQSLLLDDAELKIASEDKIIQPEEIAREITKRGGSLGSVKFNFWQRVHDYGVKTYPNIKWRSPGRDHWNSLSVGSSISAINMLVNSKGRAKVMVSYEFWPKSKDKAFYDALKLHRDEIEKELDEKLTWARKDDNQYSKVYTEYIGDYRDKKQQDELAKWLVDTAIRFRQVFPKYDKTVKRGEK